MSISLVVPKTLHLTHHQYPPYPPSTSEQNECLRLTRGYGTAYMTSHWYSVYVKSRYLPAATDFRSIQSNDTSTSMRTFMPSMPLYCQRSAHDALPASTFNKNEVCMNTVCSLGMTHYSHYYTNSACAFPPTTCTEQYECRRLAQR